MSRLSAELVVSLLDGVSGPAARAKGSLTALQKAERDLHLANTNGRLSRRQIAEERLLAAKEAEADRRRGAIVSGASAAGVAIGAAMYAGGRAYMKFAEFERQLDRTGLKIGATREQMMSLRQDVVTLAKQYALLPDALTETVDAYAETGASLADIKADLPTLAKVQQALGASGAEMVATWDAARKSFGLTTEQAEKFFDRIAAGGNIGKFEGKDLARYLPSLLPVAAARGFKDIEGVEKLVGALETMRDYVGTSEEAALALSDFMEKVASPTVEKNFANFGINLPKALKEAKANGEDLFVVVERLLRKATGGDIDKLGHIFTDKESRRFAAMLMQQLDAMLAKIETVHDASDGMISGNVNRILDGAQARIDRLKASWDEFMFQAGASVGELGTPALDWLNEGMSREGAVNKALTDQGMSWAQRRLWWLNNFNDDDAIGRKAFEGGWRSDEGRVAEKGTRDRSPELAANRPTTPSFGFGVDGAGTPFPQSYSDRWDDSAFRERQRERARGEAFGRLPRHYGLAEQYAMYGDARMKGEDRAWNAPLSRPFDPAELENSLKTGGSAAGDAVKSAADAIRSAGRDAASAIERAAASLRSANRERPSPRPGPLGGAGFNDDGAMVDR